MKLSESASWEHEILKGAPIRLEPESIIPPDNVELTFVAIEHGDHSNTDYLAEVLSDTDIFFPEVNSWDPITAKYLQKISNGDYKAFQKVRQNSVSDFMGFVDGLTRALYNTRVDVRMADLPRTSPIPAKLSRMGYHDGLAPDAFRLMAERDKHIARTISSEIAKAQDENPKLRDKLVRATAVFGAGHISVEAALSEAARIHNIGTFSTRRLFDADAAVSTSQDAIDYNNWLRAQEEIA